MANKEVKVLGITEFSRFNCDCYEEQACECKDCTECECYDPNPDFEKIADRLQEMLQEHGYQVDVRYHRIWKNNTHMDGFEIRQSECSVAPTIYWGNDDSIQDVAKRAMNALDAGVPEIDAVGMLNPDFIKANVYPRLYEGNEDNLVNLSKSEVPFDFLEFSENQFGVSLIYTLYILIEDSQIGVGSIQVNKNIMRYANMSWDELSKIAISNMIPQIKLRTMKDTMRDMLGIPFDDDDDLPFPIPSVDNDMWVLTNTWNMYGSAMIVSKEILQYVCDHTGYSEYYIVPSSVHEVLIIPVDGMDAKDLRDMNAEVNASQVSDIDRLTDGLFYYSKLNGFLRINGSNPLVQ